MRSWPSTVLPEIFRRRSAIPIEYKDNNSTETADIFLRFVQICFTLSSDDKQPLYLMKRRLIASKSTP